MPPRAESRILLASASVARARLLRDAGLHFDQRDHKADEGDIPPNTSPTETVLHIATQKALSLQDVADGIIVLGADQVMEVNGKLLARAESIESLRAQLLSLRGTSHLLHSAAVCVADDEPVFSVVATARLTMRLFSSKFLDDYLRDHGRDVLPCLGGYRIEAEGVQLFDTVEGDIFTVQGIPLLPLLKYFRSAGILAT